MAVEVRFQYWAVCVLMLAPATGYFVKQYSSCYGLDIKQTCDVMWKADNPASEKECLKKAEEIHGNVCTFKGMPGIMCAVYRCETSGDKVIYELESVDEGVTIYVNPAAQAVTTRNRRQVLSPADEPVKFTSVALRTIIGITSLSIKHPFSPFVRVLLGTLIDILTGAGSSYDGMRTQVLADIRNELNEDAVHKMKLRLQDVTRTAQNILKKLGTGQLTLDDLEDSNSENITEEFPKLTSDQLDVFRTQMIALETNLDLMRSTFVLRRDYRLSLTYYKDYAASQISVLEILKIYFLYSNGSMEVKEYEDKIKQISYIHYKYLMLAIDDAVWAVEKSRNSQLDGLCTKVDTNKEPPELSGLPLNTRMRCLREELNEICSIEDYLALSEKTDTSVYIKNGDYISMKFSDPRWTELWLSCTHSGQQCTFSDCPVGKPPFQKNCAQRLYSCPKSVLQISAKNRQSNEMLAVCDEVLLFVGKHNETANFLNRGDCYLLNPTCHVTAQTCDDSACQGDPSSCIWRNSCERQAFNLMVPGKKCGEKVLDRDVVTLITDNNRVVTHEKWRTEASITFSTHGHPAAGSGVFWQYAGDCDFFISWILYKEGSSYNQHIYDQLENSECDVKTIAGAWSMSHDPHIKLRIFVLFCINSLELFSGHLRW